MISSGWTGNLQSEDVGSDIFDRTASAPYDSQVALYDDGMSVQPSEQGTVIRHPPNLFEDVDDSASEMDYSEDAEEELAEELEQLRDEAEDAISIGNVTTRGSGRKSRMGHRDPLPASSPARPSIVSTPRTVIGRGTEIEATPKSSKSVRFEADESIFSSQLSERADAVESDDESMSESESAVSSSDDDSSEASSDDDFVSLEAESESESESDIESSDDSSMSEEEESESEPEVQKIEKTIDVFTPPGHGSTKTRNSNRRKKLRLRLQKLKSLGALSPEANFDDLKAWEAKNGKRILTEVTDFEDLRDSRAKEQSEIEIKRQHLLQALASGGGLDVDGCSEKENIPPRYTNGKQTEAEVSKSVEVEAEADPVVSKVSAEEMPAETKGADEDEKASPSGIKRRKLDLSSTKRLLFGSLGVRTPKSKKDEEALRIKLDGSRNKYLTQTAETAAATAESVVEDENEDENWEKKIILSATECVYDDIELAIPPFPFYQRWDHDASYEIRQRRNNGKKNRKRKQRDWQDDAGTSWYDGVAEEPDEGNVTLNYDDAPSTVQKEVQESNFNEDRAEDLPTIPSDPTTLPSLTKGNTTADAIIAFKQLNMSKATNWQPQVSEYKVAKVNEVLDNGSFNLTLAKRDREIQQAAAVDENGIRTYSGFEMPEHDDDENNEGVEDDGFRNLSFEDLLEPKLLRSASPSPQEKQGEGELVNGNYDESSLSVN
jgi:hypothetical protein